MRHRAGDEIDYTVTYLDMTKRPSQPIPHIPTGAASALVAADDPPAWYFLSLYDAVGSKYEWTDMHNWSRDELEGFLRDSAVTLYSFLRAGWPNGFYVLDARLKETCDITLFGLVPQAVGRGLGWFLLLTAVHAAWDRPGVERVTVNTNSLDHPRALPLYQKVGFTPVRRERKTRVLTRDRMVTDA